MLEIIKVYIASIFFMISLFGFGMIVFNDKLTEKRKYSILLLLLSSAVAGLVFSYFDGTIKTLLLCSVFTVTLYLTFKQTVTRSIFTSLVFTILNIIPDLLAYLVTITVLNVSKEQYFSSFAGGIYCNFLVSLLMLILTYIFRKPLRKLVNYNINENKKIIFVSILTLIAVGIFFYELISTFKNSNNIIAYLVVIFTLIVILFILFKQKIDSDAISKKYDGLLNIMKNYEKDIEDQRIRIHETRNELMTIKSKISDKEKESEIVKYIDSVIGDKVSSNMSRFSKFAYLPANGLRGFFYYKFIEAERNGLKVSINVAKKIEKCFLKNLNTKDFKSLIRIIGVYLDNAIEASMESKDKKLGIELYYIDNKVKLIISNTFNENINLNKLGKGVYSTKGKNRGYGLLLVKKIIKENKIFETNTKIDDNLYIQELSITKPSK